MVRFSPFGERTNDSVVIGVCACWLPGLSLDTTKPASPVSLLSSCLRALPLSHLPRLTGFESCTAASNQDDHKNQPNTGNKQPNQQGLRRMKKYKMAIESEFATFGSEWISLSLSFSQQKPKVRSERPFRLPTVGNTMSDNFWKHSTVAHWARSRN